jgi:glycosyltransferase involved in cell wall biosynthesis
VPGDGRSEAVTTTLSSLAAQTLDATRFEVVVVHAGATDDPVEPVEPGALAGQHALTVRSLTTPATNLPEVRNLALAAARGEFVTLLEPGDEVSARYLEALLAHAEPGTVPTGALVDESGTAAPATPSNLAAQSAAKLIPTAIATALGYDENLGGGWDLAFWTHVLAVHGLRTRPVPAEDATCRRATGEAAAPASDAEPTFESHVSGPLDLIRCLDDVPSGSPETDALVSEVANDLCRTINAYLLENPGARTRLAELVDGHKPRWLDWRVVNEGTARDLALLYAFAPWNATSGMVATRRVRDRGVVVDVISHTLKGVRGFDASAQLIADPYVARHTEVPGKSTFARPEGTVEFAEAVFDTLERWGNPEYRSVYSRATWVHSHLVSAVYKLRNPSTHWIAEFSDPLSRTAEAEERGEPLFENAVVQELREGIRGAGFTPPDDDMRLFLWTEWVAYAFADEIVFTNPNQREFMLGYCQDKALADRARAVSRITRHPTPPAHFYDLQQANYKLDPDRVHLGYFGVFYPTRGLTELTTAFRALDAHHRAHVQLHVFTPNPAKVAEEAWAEGLGDVLKVNPYVEYIEFLNLIRRFDALLVNDAKTFPAHGGINPYLPSKVSDYLGSGTPIWAIHEPGSVLPTLGDEITYLTPSGDAEAAAATLRQIIADRRPEVAAARRRSA